MEIINYGPHSATTPHFSLKCTHRIENVSRRAKDKPARVYFRPRRRPPPVEESGRQLFSASPPLAKVVRVSEGGRGRDDVDARRVAADPPPRSRRRRRRPRSCACVPTTLVPSFRPAFLSLVGCGCEWRCGLTYVTPGLVSLARRFHRNSALLCTTCTDAPIPSPSPRHLARVAPFPRSSCDQPMLPPPRPRSLLSPYGASSAVYP
jgi:hypothetical protein